MKIKTNAENRKDVVKAVAEILGTPSKYLGVPSCNFQVGNCIIDRAGTVETEDEKTAEMLQTGLMERGFVEEPETDEGKLMVSFPAEGMTALNLKNLIFLIHSRQYLINQSVGEKSFCIPGGLVEELEGNELEGVESIENSFQAYAEEVRGLGMTAEQITFRFPYTKVVRLIFDLYLQGDSVGVIIKKLKQQGIKTSTGKDNWSKRTIDTMLSNDKYMGDALLQKTYTVDCLTKKRVANDGTVPQYYVNNDHEAIIPRELFARVQEEMKHRVNIRQGMDGKRRVYSSKYALSSIVFCSHCGDMYRRTHWNNHRKKQIVWRCVTRLNAPGEECPARTLSEVQLQNLVLEAINKVLGGKQRTIKVLETNISEVLGNAHIEELERIKQQIEKQQTLLVKMTAASEDYSKVVDKIYALQKEQEEAMADNVNYKAGKERIQEMIEYLKSQPKRVTVYDEQLVRKLIEKIMVYDDHLDFLFKSGIQIEIRG